MAAAIEFVFSVPGLLTGLLAGLVWLQTSKTSRWARRWLAAVTVFYWLASTYAVPFTLSRWLVAPYHPFTAANVPPGNAAIVLLGAGQTFVHDWDGGAHAVPNREGAARIGEAARVSRLAPQAVIISSGGPVEGFPTDKTDSEIMRDALVAQGVASNRIHLEDRSLTTYDEALFVKPMRVLLHIDHVILVTSDIHMRRSLGAFRSVGIDATPAIARASVERLDASHRWFPSPLGLDFSNSVAHEFVGIAGYSLRGWYK
jgi:uncharacterized SAM-binding protein YcdF (DUF218 family)